jgi:outer membrane protein TolC
VEDAIISYIKSGEIATELTKGAVAARRAMELGVTQYRENTVNYLWVYNLERALAGVLEQLIHTRGQQLHAVVDTYKSLGGGWNIPDGLEIEHAPVPPGALPKPRSVQIEDLPLPRVKIKD